MDKETTLILEVWLPLRTALSLFPSQNGNGSHSTVQFLHSLVSIGSAHVSQGVQEHFISARFHEP